MEIGKKIGVKVDFAVFYMPLEFETFSYPGMTKKDKHFHFYTGGFHSIEITVEQPLEHYRLLADIPLDVMNSLGLELKDLISFSFYTLEK